MIKTLCLAATLCAATTLTASAQDRPLPMNPYNTQHRVRQVTADGRCNGISYGTGARRCGTRTGGPAGGISSRN